MSPADEATIARLSRDAVARFPELDAPGVREGLVRHLTEALVSGAHAADVCLAFAAHRGVTEARALVLAVVRDVCDQVTRKLRLRESLVSELADRVGQRLLLGADAAILRFEGTVCFEAWVSACAHRLGLRILMETRADLPREQALALEDLQAAPAAPARLLVRHRETYGAAVDGAVRALTPRDRNLLRLHVLEGVSIEAIANAYREDVATVVRCIAGIRASLIRSVREGLVRVGRLGAEEVEELVRAFADRLELQLASRL